MWLLAPFPSEKPVPRGTSGRHGSSPGWVWLGDEIFFLFSYSMAGAGGGEVSWQGEKMPPPPACET